MGIEINVKTYLTFSVCMDFKPSLSAITYYMNDLLICRVSVINSAVLWVHKNVRKKYTSETWTFIKWSWVFINWTRKGPPSTYKVVRCAGFKPTVCTFEEMGERAVIFWVGGNYFSFPFSLADFVIFLSEHGSWVMGHVEHDPSRHQISHQDQNEFMFPTLIKLVFSHLCQCTMRHPNIIKYNCSGCATNMSSIKNNLCSHKRPCSP